jgi:hypothetical protein
MIQKQNLLNRLSNIFTKKSDSNLSQLMGAVGDQLDKVDPSQSNLEQQFSVSTATGDALDKHGRDWGVPRRSNDSDDDYRKRIQAVIPIYTNGPTVSSIKQLVKNFTGVDPFILEYGPESFTMGVSPMGSFVFSDEDICTFQVQVQNPDGVIYNETDMENAVNFAKPARSTATFIHSHNALMNGQYKLDGAMSLGG